MDKEYIQKLSEITGVPVEFLAKLRDMKLMDELEIRNCIIRAEYLSMKKSGDTSRKCMETLRGRYHLSIRQMQNIVYATVHAVKYCKRCGVQVKTGDMCLQCRRDGQ